MRKPFNVTRFTTLVLTSALFGIFDFYMYFFAVYLMELPIFFDMIFCIAISFFAGPFFGCLSVIFKNIYDNIVTDTTPLQYLYCIIAFAGCFITWGYKKFFLKESDSRRKLTGKFILLILIMIFSMSLLGAFMNWLLDCIENKKTFSYQTDFITTLLSPYIQSSLLSGFVARIPINILDRSISLCASLGLYKLMALIEEKIIEKRQISAEIAPDKTVENE